MVKNTTQALKWIITILRKHKIKFYISGGFAAKAYGSNRELADIDIEVHDASVFVIQKEVSKYIIYGPKRYIDKEFDLLLMTLKYRGQEIDICGIDSQKLYDKKLKKWYLDDIDLSKAVKKKVYGLRVPLMPLDKLIAYKKKISREVDIYDVNALTKLYGSK